MTNAQENAVRGIRANWPARRVMVTEKPEWGCVVAKADSRTFFVFPDGRIVEESK